MTPAEHRALTRAAALLLLSGLVRWGWEVRRGPPVAPPGREDMRPELMARAESLKTEEARRSAPLEADERLDPNTAPAAELDRLPGVGPATARAVVEARDALGGFRRVDDLLEVRGIGPSTLERLRPWIEVGAPPVRTSRLARTNRARPSGAAGGPTSGVPVTRERLDLNRADAEELEALPGIGPALAARVVAARRARGGFRSVEDLLEVSGIGPATLARIRERVRVRRAAALRDA